MNKKYLSQTYLKDVREYEFKMIIKEDCFVGIKKINKIDTPFYLKNGVCLINNNYYIIEILYPDRNYTIRIFLNNEKEEILYYYDIVNKIEIDEKLRIPYYEDLYLDIVVKDDNKIVDEDEFENAFKDKSITINQYELAKNVMNNLVTEIKQRKDIININIQELLENN